MFAKPRNSYGIDRFCAMKPGYVRTESTRMDRNWIHWMKRLLYRIFQNLMHRQQTVLP